MEKDEKTLQEQQAPLKNTDDAFVQVGRDGEPVIPQTTTDKKSNDTKEERATTLDKR